MRAWMSIAVVVLCLPGCGAASKSASSTRSSGAASAGSAPAATTQSGTSGRSASCQIVPVPAAKGPQRGSAPILRLDPHKAYTVTVATNCGTFAFTLDVRDSPKTSASFYVLVRRGFYNGLRFHRVAAGFVIQGGDPNGDGSGGPGYSVVERPPANTQYLRGDVAMAKTQSDPSGTSGSQFFVVTAANATQSAGLTPDYALLGKVVSGQNVVDAIGALATNPPQDGAPTPAVVMRSVTVSTS